MDLISDRISDIERQLGTYRGSSSSGMYSIISRLEAIETHFRGRDRRFNFFGRPKSEPSQKLGPMGNTDDDDSSSEASLDETAVPAAPPAPAAPAAVADETVIVENAANEAVASERTEEEVEAMREIVKMIHSIVEYKQKTQNKMDPQDQVEALEKMAKAFKQVATVAARDNLTTSERRLFDAIFDVELVDRNIDERTSSDYSAALLWRHMREFVEKACVPGAFKVYHRAVQQLYRKTASRLIPGVFRGDDDWEWDEGILADRYNFSLPRPTKKPPMGHHWVEAKKTARQSPRGTGARRERKIETKYWIPKLDSLQGGIDGPKLENETHFAATLHGGRWIPWKAVPNPTYDDD